jgi:hypothetical protein
MRNKLFAVGITGILLIFGLLMTSCPTAPEEDEKNDDIVISGTITPTGNTGGSSVSSTPKKFRAEGSRTARSVSRAAGVVSYPISGKLEDGDVIYNFKGEYEPENNVFSIQAKSTLVIFSLNGKLSADGDIDTAKSTAKIQVKSAGEWITIECNLIGGNQTVSEEAPNAGAEPEGLPSSYQGKWKNLLYPEEYFLVSENAIVYYSGVYGLTPLDVVEVAAKGNTHDIIVRTEFIDGATYTERYNISKTLQSAIENENAGIVADELNGYTIKEAIALLGSGNRLFVAPYASAAGQYANSIDPNWDWIGQYSPLFTSLADAKSIVATLHVVRDFVFVLDK